MIAPALLPASRIRRAALAMILLGATSGSAFAAGINLSWDDCGTFGTEIKASSCITNVGTPFTAVGSFVPPPGVDEFLGLSADLSITTLGPLPDWWKHGTGQCRVNAGLLTQFDFNTGPFNCVNFYEGWAAGGFAYDVAFGAPDRARLRIQCAVPVDNRGPVSAFDEYYAFKVLLTRAKSSGDGGCAGCSVPATITLNEIQLFQPFEANFDPSITTPLNRTSISWQGGVDDAPRIASFDPAAGAIGTQVTIRGINFTGTLNVNFGPTQAAFAVSSDSVISTSVPVGAITGPIEVINDVASWESFDDFTVAPDIQAFVPTQAPIGHTIMIVGVNFLRTSSVTFSGTPAAFTLQSNTALAVVVPIGAANGPITVTNPGGSDISSQSFTVGPAPAPPSISSLAPQAGPPGTIVTIRGLELTQPSLVTFGGVSAVFNSVSDTVIVATVPTAAITGAIQVSASQGTATSGGMFVVAPRIGTFGPHSGPVGTSVLIGGVNFLGTTIVLFHTTPATFSVLSNTMIQALVPPGATSGPLTVTNPGGTDVSMGSFFLGTLPTTPSMGINLSWDACGTDGVKTKTFACDSSTGMPLTMIASFCPPPGIHEFLGISGTLNIATAGPTLPDWWKHGSGFCRGTTGLSATYDFVSDPAYCMDFYTGQAAGGIAYDVGFGSPNRARLRIQAAIPYDNRGPVDPTIEYYAFKIALNRSRTIGDGSCAGCSEPMCIILTDIQLFQPVEFNNDPQISNPIDRNFVEWQAGALGCPLSTAAFAEAASIEADGGLVRVRWNMGGIESARIYRREEHRAWQFIATATSDGAHRVTYEDRDVVAGVSYSYRLGIMGPGGEVFAGETSITVPAPASLEMSRVALDAEGLLVEFAFARNAPAALEVYDLSGRRRILRRLEGLAAGTHRAHLAEARRLEPGVYFVRLHQDAQRVSRRFVIVR